MLNPRFITRDHRVIHISPGQIKSDALAGEIKTTRLRLETRQNVAIATDLTPRETLILASLLLEAYRKTLPQEEAYERGAGR
jgi:hypothetical protein